MTTADRILAVTFTVLLVLSMITPAALAAEPAAAEPGGDRVTDVSPPSPNEESDSTFDENKSSLELRFEARELLRNASIRGGPNANQQLVERVNDSMEHYTGLNRADVVRIFNHDTQVIARAKKTAPEVSDRLLASQARLAETTMADANRTVNRLEEQGADFNVRRARNQLDQVQRQFEVGEERRTGGQPNAAIAGYRQAFVRSHSLLERLNRRTDPQVELTRRADPVRNGTANYTLEGRVFAVQSSTLQNLTVTVDGDDQSVPLPSTPAPGVSIPFSTTVVIENGTSTIEVTAETLSDRGDRVVGSDTATLRLDGDGLSDRTELDLTETDPLDPDSDAAVTDVDESDNGTVDGMEDFDGDRLATVVEIRRGLDPLSADTDDDGLDDGAEFRFLETNATNPDTDGDGILDGAEDPDGDGLTNSEELAAGSHYNSTDGDRDGLSDPEELELGTQPLRADTDDDRLEDAAELDLGTDPLDPDTDDDGVIDGNETYTTSVANESLNASITFSGQGNVAAGASVTNETTVGLRNDLVNPARATEILHLDAERSFETATVNLTYDESAVPTNETDLAVFRLNHSAQFYEPVNSTVDAEDNTVTGRTNQTGVYTVLSASVLADQFSVDPNANATYHAESFQEPADCEGACGVDGGNLVVGPLEESSGTQGTSLGTSSLGTGGEIGILSTFETPVRTVTTPEKATEMTVSATVSGFASSTGSASFLAGDTLIYAIDSGNVDNRHVSTTIDVSGGETIELYTTGRSAHMTVTDVSISFSGEVGGGGTPVDLCQTVPGDQGRECPDSAVSVYEIPIPRDVANVTIQGSGMATVIGANSSVSVEVSGVRNDVLAAETANGTLSFSETYRNLSPSGSTDSLTLGIETSGLAGARLDSVTIWKDTDGDGYADERERIGFKTETGGSIWTDPFEPDTDGDSLEDGEEVGELVTRESTYYHDGEPRTFEFQFFEFNSHPLDFDTDNDGLNDSIEAGNWTVEVVNRSGTMYRWNSTEQLEDGESRGTVNFTSSPLRADTDGDGLTDYQEKERYHTDPESRVTYEITKEHQREIIGTFQHLREENNCENRYECSNSLPLRTMGFITHDPSTMDTIDDLDGFQLTDRTDDFDFVVPDDYADRDEQWSRFSFRPLDTNGIPEVQIYRTDVWLANGFESSVRLMDPWDPDTDDDGLTDGQETRGMTRIGSPEVHTDPAPYEAHLDQPIDTYPHLADSDGDGWWDGWIGVHGVGRSDNVILYNEHLHDDDNGDGETEDNGVQGHEIVQEQIGYHDVSSAPSTGGVDIDGDNDSEHSNIHLGERLLGSDVRDAGDVPDTEISLEVDNYGGADDALLPGTGWSDRLERNYRLYGLDLAVEYDESNLDLGTDLVFDSPFGAADMAAINQVHKNRATDYYLFVADRAADSPVSDVLRPGQTGISSEIASDVLNVEITDMTMIFTDAHQNPQNVVPTRLELTHDEALRAVTAKTAVHEIGHQLSIGRADDGYAVIGFEEVYSGGEDDATQEQVFNTRTNTIVDQWSVMSSGMNEEQYVISTNDSYTAFSLEELLTVDLPGN